ncbi:hypothetical protein [Parasphaerochaeta coccoides]|uniref:Uncharacterized protein n=1 Tax=Parasphaerochaeta coccoides (strain ATCC BAA-1237 / DSM 17374 / SPN1) TaxID=760011 RepID=F4GIZ7_PARC1|nr:hypothetical protein [Parasphaerochaeta coccoides]AEC01292.1 hypothetical protein Spico_0050 [Parasphaerochaeta coccoides DSM 17374]
MSDINSLKKSSIDSHNQGKTETAKALPFIVRFIPMATFFILVIVSCIACNISLPAIIDKDSQELLLLHLAGTTWKQDIGSDKPTTDWKWRHLEFYPTVTEDGELNGWMDDGKSKLPSDKTNILLGYGEKNLILTVSQDMETLEVKHSEGSAEGTETLTVTDAQGKHFYFLRDM